MENENDMKIKLLEPDSVEFENLADLIFGEWDHDGYCYDNMGLNDACPWFHSVYGCYLQNELIGGFTLIYDFGYPERKNPDCLFITCILLKKEYRGKKYGTKMIEFCKDLTKRENFYSLELFTQKCKSTSEFFLKMQFKFSAYVENIYPDGDDSTAIRYCWKP